MDCKMNPPKHISLLVNFIYAFACGAMVDLGFYGEASALALYVISDYMIDIRDKLEIKK